MSNPTDTCVTPDMEVRVLATDEKNERRREALVGVCRWVQSFNDGHPVTGADMEALYAIAQPWANELTHGELLAELRSPSPISEPAETRCTPTNHVSGATRNGHQYCQCEALAHAIPSAPDPTTNPDNLSRSAPDPTPVVSDGECVTCAEVRKITREASGQHKPFVYVSALARIAGLVHTKETWLSPSPDEEAWIHSERCPDCDYDIEGRVDDAERIFCPTCKQYVYPPVGTYGPRRIHRLAPSVDPVPDPVSEDVCAGCEMPPPGNGYGRHTCGRPDGGPSASVPDPVEPETEDAAFIFGAAMKDVSRWTANPNYGYGRMWLTVDEARLIESTLATIASQFETIKRLEGEIEDAASVRGFAQHIIDDLNATISRLKGDVVELTAILADVDSENASLHTDLSRLEGDREEIGRIAEASVFSFNGAIARLDRIAEIVKEGK